jgi:dUTPase
MILEYELTGNNEYGLTQGTTASAGWDIALPRAYVIPAMSCCVIDLEIVFNIHEGWCLHMVGRSSTFAKYGLIVPTSIIDSDYKDEVHGFIYNGRNEQLEFPAGARLFQVHMLPVQYVIAAHVAGLRDPEGRGGLGSTGI